MPPRPRRPSTSYSPIVARRSDSITPLSRGASSLAVAKAVCWPEMSEPQLGQKRAPACIGWPQWGQLVVWVVTEAVNISVARLFGTRCGAEGLSGFERRSPADVL